MRGQQSLKAESRAEHRVQLCRSRDRLWVLYGPDTGNTYFYSGSFEVGRELQVKLKEVGEPDTLA